MTRLILCRHAKPGDAERRGALARSLRHQPLSAVYTSPLARALETAEPIAAAHGLEPVQMRDLREIDRGEAGGLTFDELPEEIREELLHRPTEVRLPGGETYGELRQRVCDSLDEIVARHPGETVAVVTHAGPIRAALATWLCAGPEGVFRIDQRLSSVNVVDWIDGVPLVRLVNGTSL
jgi:probable phosphoglycerate mutase